MDDRLGESRHREEREREAQRRSVGSSPRIESPLNIEIESNRVELGAIENETRRGTVHYARTSGTTDGTSRCEERVPGSVRTAPRMGRLEVRTDSTQGKP